MQNNDDVRLANVYKVLEQPDDFLFKVFEHLPVGIWIQDEKGHIIYGNKTASEIWQGYRYVDPDQFSEYLGWWVDSGEKIQSHEWAAARAIAKGETSIDEKIKIQCFDGTIKYIINSAYPIYEGERILGAVIVNQDVTSLYEAEARLQEQNDELNKMNRLMQGRELKMIELKEELAKLKQQKATS